jgi:hypothetical protein
MNFSRIELIEQCDMILLLYNKFKKFLNNKNCHLFLSSAILSVVPVCLANPVLWKDENIFSRYFGRKQQKSVVPAAKVDNGVSSVIKKWSTASVWGLQAWKIGTVGLGFLGYFSSRMDSPIHVPNPTIDLSKIETSLSKNIAKPGTHAVLNPNWMAGGAAILAVMCGYLWYVPIRAEEVSENDKRFLDEWNKIADAKKLIERMGVPGKDPNQADIQSMLALYHCAKECYQKDVRALRDGNFQDEEMLLEKIREVKTKGDPCEIKKSITEHLRGLGENPVLSEQIAKLLVLNLKLKPMGSCKNRNCHDCHIVQKIKKDNEEIFCEIVEYLRYRIQFAQLLVVENYSKYCKDYRPKDNIDPSISFNQTWILPLERIFAEYHMEGEKTVDWCFSQNSKL